jgi:hypothetical protein
MSDTESDFFWTSRGSQSETYHIDRECSYLRHTTLRTLRASVARSWDTRDKCDACFPGDETLAGHCDCGRPVTLGSRDKFICRDCRAGVLND